MNATITTFPNEWRVSAPYDQQTPWAAVQPGNGCLLLNRIAEADRLAIERLFEDVFRSRPAAPGAWALHVSAASNPAGHK
jgi:hypothetical protein